MDNYKIVTVTHKTANINLLKDYLLQDDQKSDYPKDRLKELKESFQIKELLYLNTCNRVTFFFTADYEIDEDFLKRLFLFIQPQLPEQIIETHKKISSVYEGREAVEHLFKVASSMDSLIIGEREILGQLKVAYQKAKAHHLCCDAIRLAIEQAVVFAKKVYHETKIGERPISVVTLAFRELLKLGVSNEAAILKIGAGQTNGLLSNLLVKYGFQNVTVYNRTIEKAQQIADKFKGKALHIDKLVEHKEHFDIVISCTGSKEEVLTKEVFDQIVTDKQKKYVIMDLAVPHDIDDAIIQSYNVDYIDVASLKEEAQRNLDFRKSELVKAHGLLDEFLKDFDIAFRRRQLEHALSEIPLEVKALKAKALNEVFSKDLENLDDNAKAVIDKMMDYFEKKYISIPMKAAKKTILNDHNFRA